MAELAHLFHVMLPDVEGSGTGSRGVVLMNVMRDQIWPEMLCILASLGCSPAIKGHASASFAQNNRMASHRGMPSYRM